jgi:DNA-binding CsgD family transcriptional regulator
MARRYLAGEMLAAIGKAYNISGERVRAILRKAGVKSLGRRATGGRALTSKEKEALRLYSEGVSAPEICARVSISPPRLEYLRKREGVPAKGQGFYLRRPDDAELTSTVARLYLSGMGSTEIARTVPQIKFPETVYRYLKKAGVTPRSKRPKPIPCPSRTDGTGGKPPPVSGAGNS